jgi:hypothetical protein
MWLHDLKCYCFSLLISKYSMVHNLFTQTAVDGHLGLFQIGTVINNVHIVLCKHMFLFLLDKNLKVELLSHKTNVCLTA